MHFGFLSARPEEGGGVQRGTRSVEVDGPCNATATASGWPTDCLVLTWLKTLNKRAGNSGKKRAISGGS